MGRTRCAHCCSNGAYRSSMFAEGLDDHYRAPKREERNRTVSRNRCRVRSRESSDSQREGQESCSTGQSHQCRYRPSRRSFNEVGAEPETQPARLESFGVGAHKQPLRLWMEQPPRHGADLVEEAQGGFGLCAVDGARLGQQSQVGVNLMNDPEVIMRSTRVAIPSAAVPVAAAVAVAATVRCRSRCLCALRLPLPLRRAQPGSGTGTGTGTVFRFSVRFSVSDSLQRQRQVQRQRQSCASASGSASPLPVATRPLRLPLPLFAAPGPCRCPLPPFTADRHRSPQSAASRPGYPRCLRDPSRTPLPS